jgi:hypothetical protein
VAGLVQSADTVFPGSDVGMVDGSLLSASCVVVVIFIGNISLVRENVEVMKGLSGGKSHDCIYGSTSCRLESLFYYCPSRVLLVNNLG